MSLVTQVQVKRPPSK